MTFFWSFFGHFWEFAKIGVGVQKSTKSGVQKGSKKGVRKKVDLIGKSKYFWVPKRVKMTKNGVITTAKWSLFNLKWKSRFFAYENRHVFFRKNAFLAFRKNRWAGPKKLPKMAIFDVFGQNRSKMRVILGQKTKF